MNDENAVQGQTRLGDVSDQLELEETLRRDRPDWGEILILRPETLISKLSDQHLELIESIAAGVGSVDSLAENCCREIETIRGQVETLVETQIVGFDDDGRLIIPHETVVTGPLIASSKEGLHSEPTEEEP